MSTSFYKRFQMEEGDDLRETVNVYVVDPERLDQRRIEEMVRRLYPGEEVRLVSLVQDKVNLNHIVQHRGEFRRLLADFDQERDRLIVVGRSMANFLTGQVLGEMRLTEVTLLMFDFETGEYNELTIELSHDRS